MKKTFAKLIVVILIARSIMVSLVNADRYTSAFTKLPLGMVGVGGNYNIT